MEISLAPCMEFQENHPPPLPFSSGLGILPTVERLETGYPFFGCIFRRGTLPNKTGLKRALLKKRLPRTLRSPSTSPSPRLPRRKQLAHFPQLPVGQPDLARGQPNPPPPRNPNRSRPPPEERNNKTGGTYFEGPVSHNQYRLFKWCTIKTM